jgi:hypothetical protein
VAPRTAVHKRVARLTSRLSTGVPGERYQRTAQLGSPRQGATVATARVPPPHVAPRSLALQHHLHVGDQDVPLIVDLAAPQRLRRQMSYLKPVDLGLDEGLQGGRRQARSSAPQSFDQHKPAGSA